MPDQIVQLQTNSAAGSGGETGRFPLTRFRVKELTGDGVARCHTLTENGEGELDYYVYSYNALVDSEIFAGRVEGNTGGYQNDFPLEWLGLFDGFIVNACDGTFAGQIRTLVFGVGFGVTFPEEFPNTALVSLRLVSGLAIDVDFVSCEIGAKVNWTGFEVITPDAEAPFCGVIALQFDSPPPPDDSGATEDNPAHEELDVVFEGSAISALAGACFAGSGLSGVAGVSIAGKVYAPGGFTGTKSYKEVFYDSIAPGAFKNNVWTEHWENGRYLYRTGPTIETIVTLGPCTTP